MYYRFNFPDSVEKRDLTQTGNFIEVLQQTMVLGFNIYISAKYMLNYLLQYMKLCWFICTSLRRVYSI